METVILFLVKDDPISAHLFSIEDNKWKNQRTKLAPTFTSGKIKMMFPIVAHCSGTLAKILKPFAEQEMPLDIRDLAARYTIDVIGLYWLVV